MNSNNLPKITQVVSGRAENQTQAHSTVQTKILVPYSKIRPE